MENLIEKYSYLKFLDRPLDNQQLKVCCRTDNTVVAAGAGSGKTQVLATRFAWLVMEFDDITAPSILTLTFTKKAAAEMYSRIYETLKKFAYDTNIEIPERQRKNAIRALSEFANVHIQTLDSYCGSIVRQAANRYGIRPDFSTGSADAARNIKNLALPFILKHKNNPGILHYAKAGRLQEFAENVFAEIIIKHTSLATSANYFQNSLVLQCSEIINAWNENVKNITNALNNLEMFCKENPDYINASYPEVEKIFSGSVPEFNLIEKIDWNCLENENSVLKNVYDIIGFLELFEPIKLTKGARNLGEIFKPMIYKIKGSSNDKNNCLLGYAKSIASFFSEYEYIREMFLLLDEFSLQINTLKRNTGALTFADVSEMALKILIEQKDIRKQEKESYSKIMIDEFQDNNGKNRDLLFILSESDGESDFVYDENDFEAVHETLKHKIVKDKLFFVGDEKQSIYKFRGADVSVFNELKKDLEAVNGSDSFIQMIYNYRSDPALLSTFNILFGAQQCKDGQYVYTGKNAVFNIVDSESFEASYPQTAVAKYVDKVTHHEQPGVELNADNVRCHTAVFINGSEYDNAKKKGLVLNEKNQLMYFIASRIKELHDAGVNYNQIAVLEKGRTDRPVLKNWLERFKIPYQMDSQSNLFGDAVVNDIYNFLRLCVYPSDLNSYSAYLCSPLAGLSESALEKILSVQVDVKDPDFVFDAFNQSSWNRIKEVLGESSVEYNRFVNALDYYQNMQKKVLSQPITETLNAIWYEQGYRYETILNSNVNSFEEQYDLLFEIARTADLSGNGVAWFIDQLALTKNTGFANDDSDMDTKDVTYPLERESGVQIMTIHKSKGLQFDYVFVTGCFGGEKTENSSDFYFDQSYGVTLRPQSDVQNYFFLKVQDVSNQKNLAEFRRIIYVGATRAIKELYLVGSYNVTSKGEHKDRGPFEPLISNYYPEILNLELNQIYEESAPFDIIKIPVVPVSVYEQFDKVQSVDSLRTEKIKNARKWIEEVSLISTPVLESNRISPSAMETPYDEEEEKRLRIEQKDNVDLYPEIDQILQDIEKDNKSFGFDEFGTLVHFYLEQTCNGLSADEIESDAQKFLRKLDNKQKTKLTEVCLKICERFYKTSVGEKLQNAITEGRKVRAEHTFKSFMNNMIVTGSIDLYFENPDGTITIVDYKTDHTINMEKYRQQQLCYKKAVQDLYQLPEDKVNCILYFIRFDLFVDVR